MSGTHATVSSEGGSPDQTEPTLGSGIRPQKPKDEVSYIIQTGVRRAVKHTNKALDEDEPLVDTTAPLQLRSKKTGRAQKRSEQKQRKAAARPVATSLLDLPSELLQDILSYLRPSDIGQLLLVNRGVFDFVREHENSVIREIVQRRYWVLSQCFPLPVAFEDVESSAHPALLSERRQEMLEIHKKPYQHVKGIDRLQICTCINCVFAWNNLCLILDLSHWQKSLDDREPIPMIPRGTSPEWNKKLLDRNAAVVETAMVRRLCYASILEKHLRTTVATINRTVRGKKTVHPNRLYHLNPAEAAKGTDEFLERSGPPSYEFPWHRDNYYGLEAYITNRKWSKEKGRWLYYAEGLHERDLQWVKERFTPTPYDHETLKQLKPSLKDFREQAALQQGNSVP